ncbi:hypothetical protein, partial [Micromonospora sp. NPDC023814]|uniref:hypothetical protein n=1 Tax=Micromonospora sp. NPDC023814 TaxID=3154596 RepID=UPI0033C2C39D
TFGSDLMAAVAAADVVEFGRSPEVSLLDQGAFDAAGGRHIWGGIEREHRWAGFVRPGSTLPAVTGVARRADAVLRVDADGMNGKILETVTGVMPDLDDERRTAAQAPTYAGLDDVARRLRGEWPPQLLTQLLPGFTAHPDYEQLMVRKAGKGEWTGDQHTFDLVLEGLRRIYRWYRSYEPHFQTAADAPAEDFGLWLAERAFGGPLVGPAATLAGYGELLYHLNYGQMSHYLTDRLLRGKQWVALLPRHSLDGVFNGLPDELRLVLEADRPIIEEALTSLFQQRHAQTYQEITDLHGGPPDLGAPLLDRNYSLRQYLRTGLDPNPDVSISAWDAWGVKTAKPGLVQRVHAAMAVMEFRALGNQPGPLGGEMASEQYKADHGFWQVAKRRVYRDVVDRRVVVNAASYPPDDLDVMAAVLRALAERVEPGSEAALLSTAVRRGAAALLVPLGEAASEAGLARDGSRLDLSLL